MALSSLPGAPTIGASAPAPSTPGGALASLPGAPKIAPVTPAAAPQPAAPSTGQSIYNSIRGFFGLNTPTPTPAEPAPVTPPAAASSTLASLPGAPKIAPAPPAAGSEPEAPPEAGTKPGPYFYGQDSAGNTIGASDQNDTSGVPYFAYKTPDATATTTDYTRVATKFDPTVAKPMSSSDFYNARGVAARASLKEQMGGTYSDELDHTIALELAGSNNPANLRVEQGRTTPGGESYDFDKMENDLAKEVVSGDISLAKAQYMLASAKAAAGDKNPVPTVPSLQAPASVTHPSPQHADAFQFNPDNALQDPSIVRQYAEEAAQAKSASDTANAPSTIAKQTVSQIANWAYTLGSTALDHLKSTVLGGPSAWLGAGEGAVQTAIVKPAAFIGGIGSALLHQEDTSISSLFGNQPRQAPTNVAAKVASMNDNLDRTPDEQKAYDTGQFLGWMVPYSRIANGVQAAADATKVAQIVPKIAPLIPYISDAAGFLGTGQVLHAPDEGTRFQQLKNDTLALALFDVGGFALKGGLALSAKGLGRILSPAAKATADEAMKPVISSMKAGVPVPIETLDHAVTIANSTIEESTGKTPQALIQDHFGLNEEASKIPLSPETTPAHNTIDKAIPMYHEQEMGRYQKGLDAIDAAKAQLSTLQKQLKNAPEDPALQSEEQKAAATKAASLQEYIDKNKTYHQYWSGTKPGDSEPRAQAVLNNMSDTQAAAYHEKYLSDVKQHVALGYDMPKNITDQFPETKVPEAAPAPDLHQAGHDTLDNLSPEEQAPLLEKAKAMSEDQSSPYFGQSPQEIAADSLHTDQSFSPEHFASTEAGTGLIKNERTGDMEHPSIVQARSKSNAIPETHTIDTPERENLRQSIASDLYGEGAKNHDKRADIVLGLPAAGKSERLAKPLAEAHGSLIIDSDAAKEKLPEYENGIGAEATHKESDQIAMNKILPEALKNKDNIVLPFIGKNKEKIQGIIDELHSQGYDVYLHSNKVNLETSKARALSRFQKTGRFVDPEYIHHMGLTPDTTYDSLKGYGKVKGTSQVTNEVPRGQQPKLLEENNSGLPDSAYEAGRSDTKLGGNERVRGLNNLESNDGKQRQNENTSAEASRSAQVAGSSEGDRRVLPNVGTEAKEIKLPEFPRKSGPLLGVAFPGADLIGKFIEKDIIEKFGGAKDAIKGIYAATKDMFSTNIEHEKAAAIVGSGLMRVQQYASSAWKVAENRRDWWAKMSDDEQYDFINKVETGGGFEEFNTYGVGIQRTMAELAMEYRDRLNKAFKFEDDSGVKENYIENYFPHMWDDPDAARRVFSNIVKGMPTGYSKAFGSFKDARVVDLIATGRSLGLKLITSNPEELVIMREIDGQRISSRMEMMRELEQEGLAHPTEASMYGSHPGWPLIKSSDGKMYAVTPDAAKVLNNAFFAPSFWTMNSGPMQKVASSMFKTMMAIKGTVVPFQLSLSGFHPFHVQTIASADAITAAFQKVLAGNMGAAEGFTEMAKGLSLVPTIAAVKDYWNIGKAWDTPIDQLEPRMKTAVQAIIDGGGTPKISEEFNVRAADAYKKAIGDGNYIGAGIRMLPKIPEALQEPILGKYVPSLKIGAYLSKVEDLLHANPELATDDVARKVAYRAAWKEVDSRFGEMVYKTKFWNPLLTQVGEASFLSLGWQLGFVDQFGGGALDLAKLIAKGGKAIVGQGAAPTTADLTSRTVFSIVYTMQAAMWGGLMTYAMTGKMPQTMQDLFYPNTGKINSDGSEARLNTPFYTREFFSLSNHIKKEGVVGGPVTMVEDKASPILNSLAEIWNNKDFYGYNIHDSNSSVPAQAAQVAQYLFKNNFTPISIQGAIQASGVTGKVGAAASLAGFNPAPKYIAENSIQTQISAVLDQRLGGTKPLESKPAADAKSNIKKLYKSGDTAGANTALKAAIDAGYIKSTGLTSFMKDADLPGDVAQFKALTQFPSDQEALLAKMSEDDLKRYAQYAATSVKAKLSSLSPAAAQFVKDIKSGKLKVDTFKAGKVITAQ